MISPTSSALLTIGIVGANTVLNDKKKVTGRYVIGSGIYLFFLATFNDSNPELAAKVAFLVLIGALLVNGADIFKKLGI